MSTAGRTEGQYASVDFLWRDEGFPLLVDLLEDGTAFFVEGSAITSFEPDGLAGWFTGRLSLVQGVDTLAPPVASCYSARHRFEMSR